MKDSRRRVLVVLWGYLILVGIVVVHLADTMLRQNDVWLTRSYGNRWAFRDVPTRRGAIRDRSGEVLVRDVPTSTLEVHYWTFRREHPCGAAVYAANLALSLGGVAQRFTFTGNDVGAAFRTCLCVPVRYLAAAGDSAEPARDLRFYVTSLLAALTGGSKAAVGRQIRELVAAEVPGSVVAALGLDPGLLAAEFDRRLAELADIAARLPGSCDLWGELQRFEREHAKWSGVAPGTEAERQELRRSRRREQVPAAVHRNLPYTLARDLAAIRDWHPGLIVRPSVDRARGADGLAAMRWDTLANLLGSVTFEWDLSADRLEREQLLEELAPRLEEMALADGGLDEELRDHVAERLRQTMSAHLAARGRVGRSGVERDLNDRLRGTAGLHWLLRGRGAREVGLWSSFDVTPGEDLDLTVDLRLQNLLESALDRAPPGRVAACALVDPDTGDVLALASRPLAGERAAPDQHKLDPTISWWGTGYLGSLAKPLVLLEHLDALRHGRPCAHHDGFAPCQGTAFMPDADGIKRHRLRCDAHHGDGVHDPVASLGRSCNAFFFQAAEGLRWEGLRRAYARFGLRVGVEADFAAAHQPHVRGIPRQSYPDPEWGPERDFHRRAIGYQVSANVLQVARAYAGLATGRLPELSLVKRDASELRAAPLDVHPEDLALVREGLQFCVSRGTAAELALADTWAKTGTAEISAKTRANNAWLAGYTGRERPRMAFACVVYDVAHEGYGADVAGPIVRDLLEKVRADERLSEEYL